MKIDQDLIKELQTDDGHMGEVTYDPGYQKLPRREVIINELKKMNIKNVVHIGCCGHLKNIKKQIENKTSLHMLLIQNFEKVIGFDINGEAVQFFSKYAENIYARDVLKNSDEILSIIHDSFGEEPYVVLIPEVLEHTPNPVAFLEYIHKSYCRAEDKIVITVPNAYGFGRICDALFHNKECMNMDHKYTFTPTTLLKVMVEAGITPKELQFMDLYKYSKLFKKPICANTILAIGDGCN